MKTNHLFIDSMNKLSFRIAKIIKKHLLGLSFLAVVSIAQAAPDIALADKYYTSGNLTKLAKMYAANPKNRTIAYFYARASLNKNSVTAAETFIKSGLNDYMRTDLIRKLLIFYFKGDKYSDYLRIFNLLTPSNLASNNEKCGHDLASQLSESKPSSLMDVNWLITNNIPNWCAQLVIAKHIKISDNVRDLMLYNLIINDKTDIFNQIAPELKVHPLNFSRHLNTAAKRLPNNTFLIVYRIINVAKKNPEAALSEFNSVDLNDAATEFLGNNLAMQFARKHEFAKALSLYTKYGENLNDDEFEWLARSYLFSSNWKGLIATINKMPNSLKTKNTWIYWLAKAHNSLGKTAESSKILNSIPNDYSYYSILARSELEQHTTFKTKPPKVYTLSDSNAAQSAKLALELYNLGKKIKSKNLVNLGTAEWNFTAKNDNNEKDLLAMSNITNRDKIYDLSIAAANQMKNRYIELSFPIPFKKEYAQYGKLFGIDVPYALAITRQESRFNWRVIAFDGGVGLMQIMPQTGSYIASKSHSPNCYRQSAECNIKFGVWYLGSLFSKFNNFIYATAAYNAGPTRSRRWQDKLNNLDNLVQIELIPISITRDYVQKVLTNKAIYDSEFANTSKINLFDYVQNLGNPHYLNVEDDDHTDAYKLR
jgi:soluble lytic murein transglycosylase-like protein